MSLGKRKRRRKIERKICLQVIFFYTPRQQCCKHLMPFFFECYTSTLLVLSIFILFSFLQWGERFATKRSAHCRLKSLNYIFDENFLDKCLEWCWKLLGLLEVFFIRILPMERINSILVKIISATHLKLPLKTHQTYIEKSEATWKDRHCSFISDC